MRGSWWAGGVWSADGMGFCKPMGCGKRSQSHVPRTVGPGSKFTLAQPHGPSWEALRAEGLALPHPSLPSFLWGCPALRAPSGPSAHSGGTRLVQKLF